MNIHHGHLINNNHICLQRILCISLKMHSPCTSVILRHPIQLQKSVYGLCLISGSLCHSFGCPACRCSQPKLSTFSLKKSDDCIDRSCFSCTWSSGQYEKSMASCFCHCFFLHFIQHCTCFLFNGCDPLFYNILILRTTDIQLTEHSGSIQLQIIILAGIDDFFALLFLHYQLSVQKHIH